MGLEEICSCPIRSFVSRSLVYLFFLIAKCILFARFDGSYDFQFGNLVTGNHLYKCFVPMYFGVVTDSGSTLKRTAPVLLVLKTVEIYESLEGIVFKWKNQR